MAAVDIDPRPTMLISPYGYKLGRPVIPSMKATKKPVPRQTYWRLPLRSQPAETWPMADSSSRYGASLRRKANDKLSTMPFSSGARTLAPLLTHDDFATAFASKDNTLPCSGEDGSSNLFYVASSYRYKKIRKLNTPGAKRYRMCPGDGFSGDEARPTGLVFRKKRLESVTHLGMLELAGQNQRSLKQGILSARRRMDCGPTSACLANFTLREPVSQVQPVPSICYRFLTSDDPAVAGPLDGYGEMEGCENEISPAENDTEDDCTTERPSPVLSRRVSESLREQSSATSLGQKGVGDGGVDGSSIEGRHNTAEPTSGSTWVAYEVSGSEYDEAEMSEIEVQTKQSLEMWSNLLRPG